MNGAKHLSREEILLLLEGELSAEETVAAEQHLAACEPCRALQQSTEKTFASAFEETLRARPRPVEAQRTQLHERMQHHRRSSLLRIGMASAAAALLVAGGIGFSLHPYSAAVKPYVEDRPVPNPSLTPGAVRAIAFAEVCSASDDDLDPTVPAQVQQVVFAEYHVPQQQRGREFQVDYLINPQLGGTAEVKNLWPQPYTTVWNAQTKDMLEKRLYARVCSGQLSLEQAQQALSSDWIASYQREFKTKTPLRVEAGLEEPELP